MAYVPKDTKFDFSKQLFPHLLEVGLPMYGVKLDGVWFDVGTPKELINAQNHLVKNHDSLPFGLPKGELIHDLGYLINNSITHSKLCRTVLSSNSVVGHDCELIDNIIMEGSTIGNNCSLIRTVIGANVIVDDNCELIDCVIGDEVHITAGTKLTFERVSK
jgi:NDP-sugar pyrophosphorylase family protein